jgi:hypothetical protein
MCIYFEDNVRIINIILMISDFMPNYTISQAYNDKLNYLKNNDLVFEFYSIFKNYCKFIFLND